MKRTWKVAILAMLTLSALPVAMATSWIDQDRGCIFVDVDTNNDGVPDTSMCECNHHASPIACCDHVWANNCVMEDKSN
jgi:hypothetical protein